MIRCLLSLVLWCVTAGPALAQDGGLPDDLAKLVPGDSVGLVVLRSAREVAQQLEYARVKGGVEGKVVDEKTVLKEFLEGYPADLAAIDVTRPVAMAFRFSPKGPEPQPVFLVPCADPKALMDSLRAYTGFEPPLQSGSYVGLATAGAAYGIEKPPRLLDGMPSGMVAARIDLIAVIAKYRPIIDMGFEQFEQMIASGQLQDEDQPVDMSEVFDSYLEIGRDLVDSADLLDLSIDKQAGDVAVALALLNREGSPLAKYALGDVVDYRALASRLDPKACVQMITAYDQGSMLERYWPIYESMFAAIEAEQGRPPAMITALKTYIKGVQELMPKFGRLAATSFGIGKGGARMAGSYQSPDPTGLLKGILDLLRDPSLSEMGIGVDEPAGIELGGVKGTGFKGTLDLAKFMAALNTLSGLEAGMDPDASMTARLESFSDNAFGKDGARVAFFPNAGNVGMLIGGDDAWRVEMAKRLAGGGDMLPTLQGPLAAIAGMNPAMLVQIDLGRGLGSLADWMTLIDAEERAADDVNIFAEALGNQPLPASMYWGCSKARWIAGARIDLEGLLRFMQAAKAADRAEEQRNQAQADIETIAAALSEYSRAHGDKLPESLEQLTNKDAAGHALLPTLPKDPWGRSYIYERGSGAGKAPYRVRTFGADGKEGGSGANADRDNRTASTAGEPSGEEKPFIYHL